MDGGIDMYEATWEINLQLPRFNSCLRSRAWGLVKKEALLGPLSLQIRTVCP